MADETQGFDADSALDKILNSTPDRLPRIKLPEEKFSPPSGIDDKVLSGELVVSDFAKSQIKDPFGTNNKKKPSDFEKMLGEDPTPDAFVNSNNDPEPKFGELISSGKIKNFDMILDKDRRKLVNAELPDFANTADMKMYTARTNESVLGKAATALGVEEHVAVKGIYKMMGEKDLPNLSDYTYSRLLTRLGITDDDSWGANVGGFALSVLLAPSTYLSLGSSTVAKIGVKGLPKMALNQRVWISLLR